MIHIILNGKKAGYESVRSAIDILREEVDGIEVRVTYEYGDVKRFVNDAVRDGVARIVIGGGDGSVNEVVDAMSLVSCRLVRPMTLRPPAGFPLTAWRHYAWPYREAARLSTLPRPMSGIS